MSKTWISEMLISFHVSCWYLNSYNMLMKCVLRLLTVSVRILWRGSLLLHDNEFCDSAQHSVGR